MSQQWPGGLIRKTPPTPTGPYQDGTAPGVWTLDQMNYWLKQGLWPIAGNQFTRGLFAGGDWSGYVNVINYVNISSTGDGADFGDLINPVKSLAGLGSSTRGVFGGGFYYSGGTGSTWFNVIQYTTFATVGDAVDFGDLATGRTGLSAANSSTRGVFIGGEDSGGSTLTSVEYITIASTGNATDWGTTTGVNFNAACSSPTRAVYNSSGTGQQLYYITIATTGSSSSFGTLGQRFYGNAACSNSTRGLFAGSVFDTQNTIAYVTIATTGNSVDFGDLSTGMYYFAGCSSSTRGLFGAGQGGSSGNVLQYVTIASTGNAIDFGDLPQQQRNIAACSSSNGGL